jgi:hypothetical protein
MMDGVETDSYSGSAECCSLLYIHTCVYRRTHAEAWRNVLVFLMRSTKALLACPYGLALSGCDICGEDNKMNDELDVR